MGREIRQVAIGWEHPRYDAVYGKNVFRPLMARSSLLWEIEDRKENPDDYDTPEPNLDDFMPSWPEGTPLGYCMYETVSEGTPVSPVFATKDELRDWLIGEGFSPEAAAKFVETGWAPSFVGIPGRGIVNGVEALPLMGNREATP